MIAGLPGIGIGGLFYLLLVVLMPARELYLAIRGRASAARLRTIGTNFAMAAGILVSLFGGWHLISLLIDLMATIEAIGPSLRQAARDAGVVSSWVAAVTGISILLFMVFITALGDFILRRGTEPAAPRPFRATWPPSDRGHPGTAGSRRP